MSTLIEFDGVCKYYQMGDTLVKAADHVSFKINKGEFVAIVGQSGSGKSTCMNIIGCLDVPTEGTYLLDGRDVGKMSRRELAHIRNEKLGFIFQQYNLLPKLTLLENVEVPLVYAGIPAAQRHATAKAALERVSATPPVRISRTLRGVSVNSQCAPAGTYPKRSYRWRWPPSMAMSQPAACIRSCASCISKARCPLPRLRPSTHTVPMPPTRRAVPAMLKSCIFRQYSPAGAPSSYSTVCSGALSAPGPYSLGSSVGKSTFPSGVRNASSANAKSYRIFQAF